MSFALAKFSRHFKGINRTVEVDPAEYTDEVRQYFFEYGWTQAHADSYASAKTTAERNALFDKRYESLLAGELRTVREGDPVAREITKLATEKANEHFKAKGVQLTKIPAEDWKAVMTQLRGNEKLIALAKANVEARNALDIEITV